MGKESKIGWTNGTHNIVWGCEKVSPACDNCYAAELDKRYHGKDNHWGDNPRRLMSDKYWREPLKWNKEAAAAGKRFLVFCSSMADVFEKHPTVAAQRERLWPLIRQTPALTWLLLTKRPQFIHRELPEDLAIAKNVWLGTTVENSDYLWRIDALCENSGVPVRFVSMEPLLAKTSLAHFLGSSRINWAITGCESGKGARHTPSDWYRLLRDECAQARMPFFFKQAPHGADGVTSGAGSWTKLKDMIIESPYLDGKQWIQFPDGAAA